MCWIKDFSLLVSVAFLSFYFELSVSVDRNLQLYQNVNVVEGRLSISQTIKLDKAVKCAAKCAAMERKCEGYRSIIQ